MKIDRHVYFSDDTIKKIELYQKKNNMRFSTAVCKLVDVALENVDVNEQLDGLKKDISYLTSNNRYIFLLLQQLYSDLDFENITNPKKSKPVNEFMKKLKGNNFND